MDNERLEQQMAFCLEIDKEKFIGRQTYLTGAVRRENDAEHAWHMAIMTILLSEYANEEIDVLRTVTMLLIHDLVEIDAGDTYAYDEEGKKTQKARELAAADRIANQSTHIAALQQEIEKLRAQNSQLRGAAALVAKESAELLEQRWIPATERLPETESWGASKAVLGIVQVENAETK